MADFTDEFLMSRVRDESARAQARVSCVRLLERLLSEGRREREREREKEIVFGLSVSLLAFKASRRADED